MVGAPVVAGAGFIALLVVVFTGDWGGSLVTVAHEGGHMVMSVLVLRGFKHFSMDDGDNAGTEITDPRWGVGDFLATLAGYATPPLLGLGGAAVLAAGNAWAVLACAIVFLLGAFLYARGGLANLVTAIALVALVLVLWRAPVAVQTATAVGLVWLMLIGGLRSALIMSRKVGSDAYRMARRSLVPTLIWKTLWVGLAVAALYVGGRLLFTGSAWPEGVWPFDVRA